MNTILVTGGAGFIGSALVRHLIANTDHHVVNVDRLTYAGNLESLYEVEGDSRYCFEQIDICDAAALRDVFGRHRPRAVMHLAAESHVDRSIDGPAEFIRTNVVGTYTLLEAAREYWSSLDTDARDTFRFLHVSTDEVYGDLGQTGKRFMETTPYDPSSPYSASKAASDHLVRAWHRTYGLPTVITNCSNNYGPYQFPEKLIPLMIMNALDQQPLPIYGSGEQVRDWLYVDDHVRALLRVLEDGTVGRTYNIGGGSEMRNIDIVRCICRLLDELAPSKNGRHEELITFVSDRPGHDVRYAIDASRIKNELGWMPRETFDSGLRRTVEWYLENREWCHAVRDRQRRGRACGMSDASVRSALQ